MTTGDGSWPRIVNFCQCGKPEPCYRSGADGHRGIERIEVVPAAASSLPGGERERDEDSTAESAPASRPRGGEAEEIRSWDSDHTALVHVLWAIRRRGLSLADYDEIASLIMQSRWMRAVRLHAPSLAEAEGRSLSPEVGPEVGVSGSWEEAVEGATEKLADHLVRRYHARKCDETTEQARDLVTVVLRAAWSEGDDGQRITELEATLTEICRAGINPKSSAWFVGFATELARAALGDDGQAGGDGNDNA